MRSSNYQFQTPSSERDDDPDLDRGAISSGYYETWRENESVTHPSAGAPFLDSRFSHPQERGGNTIQEPQDWPHQPQLLKRFTSSTVFSVLGDLFLFCAWTAVLFFAAAIERSNGHSQGNLPFSEKALSQGKTVIPTLFPILFAATVGRCLKLISMYRVEQGERLEVLDRLLGSTTFMGTFITAITMVSLSATAMTIALFLIWALSPLGGQAAFRSFYWQANNTETPATFPYLGSNNTYNIPYFNSGRKFEIARVNALFSGSILGSRNSIDSSMDLWGNIKIPAIEALAERGTVPDSDGWYDALNTTTTDYSSLLGIPVRRDSAVDNMLSRFVLETSYWTLQCSRIGVGELGSVITDEKMTESLPLNYTTNGALKMYTNRAVDVQLLRDSPTLEARRIVFDMAYWDHITADCRIQTTYVETEVTCKKRECTASRVRQSQKKHASQNYTFLDEEDGYRDNMPYFTGLVDALLGRTYYPSILTSYIARTLGVEPFAGTEPNTGSSNFWAKYVIKLRTVIHDTPNDFIFLFAQLLNTYWMAASGTNYVLDGGVSGNYTAGAVPTLQHTQKFVNFENATAAVWSGEPIFTYSKSWLAFLFIAALVPLIACIANIILTCWLIRGPPLAMNFSTLTRDNLYIKIPPNGSALSDSDRGKMLKSIRLFYGDVAADERVGHVAIAIADSDSNGNETRKLGRGRQRIYD
ncbi:hypothetical protein QBC43DRAFT_336965 [Cladorrhinum sp. PSN259]|nr:hypothetical protein QBC43DRAFT_336965 [Cladorrhinum sp. PSN259]